MSGAERRNPEWDLPRIGRTERGSATGEDLEQCLRSAEAYLRQSFEARRHEQNIRLTLFSLTGATLLSLIGSLTVLLSRGFYLDSLGSALSLMSTISLFIAAAVFIATLRRRSMIYNARRSRQRVLAATLARLVDDTYQEVGRRESWSEMRFETVKLRLAAFPLLEDDTDGYRPRRLFG